jgi:hypothetical protein
MMLLILAALAIAVAFSQEILQPDKPKEKTPEEKLGDALASYLKSVKEDCCSKKEDKEDSKK